MVLPFVSLALIFTCFCLLKFLKSTKLGLKQFENGGSSIEHRELIPIPGVPFFKGLTWMIVYGQGSIIKFLVYVTRWGEIFEARFWKMRFTIVNDFQLGKELFKNPIFCGKPHNELMNFHSHGLYGVINPYGPRWRLQRKFAQNQLKDFGFGTKSMETLIQNEIDDLVENWCREKGKVFSPNQSFYIPIVSSIWVILAGERASAQDPIMVQMVYRLFEDFRAVLGFPEILLMFFNFKLKTMNRINYWVPIFPGIKAFQESTTELRAYFENVISERKSRLNEKEEPTDFLDGFLMKINETTDPDSEFFGKEGDKHLIAAMMDFFMAGGDTTATMLAWIMLHLIRNPDMQEKIRNEIDVVVGTFNRPSLEHRPECPYTEAFICEVLRYSPIASASMPHTVTEDTNINQYFIKKGTFLFLNIYNIHNDPNIWGDPQNFRPERFLSEDGKKVLKPEALCVFSLGQRRCVGEQVARDNLFLFVSAICQRFILKPDPSLTEPPPLLDKKSAVHCPEVFNMVALDRLELKRTNLTHS